jgi:hypothetical protein
MDLIKQFFKPSLPGRVWVGLCFGLSVLCFQPVKAQSFSFSDLFGQGEKDIKNMEAQIAALNAFETSVRQGYNMLHSEWTAIGNWKNDEFNLHQSYYTSLSTVSPVVKDSVNLSTIQSEQQSIISQFNGANYVNGLTANEQSYVNDVAQSVITQCNSDLDELQKVLTSGTLQMSDDERIKRINQLTTSIQDKYLFTCHFTAQVKLLALSRTQETDQIQTERSIYGIN